MALLPIHSFISTHPSLSKTTNSKVSPHLLFLFHDPSLPLKPISTTPSHRPLRLTSASSTPQRYVYPDPIPEFAEAETRKFRIEILKKLLKNKETFGDDAEKVVNVCAEIFSNFLQKEYGGPGTLLVEPFTDMLIALKENKIPGAPIAARMALLWAQNHVDQDWETWTTQPPK